MNITRDVWKNYCLPSPNFGSKNVSNKQISGSNLYQKKKSSQLSGCRFDFISSFFCTSSKTCLVMMMYGFQPSLLRTDTEKKKGGKRAGRSGT